MARSDQIQYYSHVLDELTPTQKKAFAGLLRFHQINGYWATASEVKEFLVRENAAEITEDVQKRLSELKGTNETGINRQLIEEHREKRMRNGGMAYVLRPNPEGML